MSTEQQKRADRIGELIAEIEINGVQAERERCAAVVASVRKQASPGSVSAVRTVLDRCHIGITRHLPESEPLAPEPMTVAKVMTIFRTAFGFNLDGIADDVEIHLADLVQAQARRDAEIVDRRGCNTDQIQPRRS
jgi:hypothetical protein